MAVPQPPACAQLATSRRLNHNSSNLHVQCVMQTQSGEPFWNYLNITPIRGPDGAVTSLVGVQSDISELMQRKQAEQDLWEQKVAAETAVEAKSMFLANMSHEVRLGAIAVPFCCGASDSEAKYRYNLTSLYIPSIMRPLPLPRLLRLCPRDLASACHWTLFASCQLTPPTRLTGWLPPAGPHAAERHDRHGSAAAGQRTER